MDREQVRLWESRCIEEQPPACVTACPLHVDARKLAELVAKGDFAGGYSVLAAAFPLPSVLANICDHPCQWQCKRAKACGAIQIHELERACAKYGASKHSRRFPSQQNKSALVVGGELGGVSAAILLAQRGYKVALFESGPELLGSLRGLGENVLPRQAIEEDLETLATLGVSVYCDQRDLLSQKTAGLLRFRDEFDAVFFEARSWPSARAGDRRTLTTENEGVFVGNAWQELSPVFAVYEGGVAAVSIDRFLQGASLTANRENQGAYASRLFVNLNGYAPEPIVEPAAPSGYTREMAQQEAGRCFPCRCMECVKACEYLHHYGAYPKRYVREMYNNECIIMGVRKANRMINSCSLCGLCAKVCPEKLSMAEVCLTARRGMVKSGKMPPSAHDFALRDMEFSNSAEFSLARHQPGFATSAVAFLPGCQLSGSMPEHVESCYRELCAKREDGVGLILGCCGAPALWAGDEVRFGKALDQLRNNWLKLDRPEMISACPSCYKTIREHLLEIKVTSLWEILSDAVPPSEIRHSRLALHDPCSTREFPEIGLGVRRLLERLGVEIEELNAPGLTTCCGFGGLAQFANRDLAAKTIQRRSGQSASDYVTYCAMCRDRFAHEGKRALHLLDLIFPQDKNDLATRPDPGFSERQENRRRLKSRLLREIWSEETSMEQPIAIEISADLLKILEERMILVEDVRKVVQHIVESGEGLQNPQTGHVLGRWTPACVTYWVEYSEQEGKIVVHNAYSHRMQVK